MQVWRICLKNWNIRVLWHTIVRSSKLTTLTWWIFVKGNMTLEKNETKSAFTTNEKERFVRFIFRWYINKSFCIRFQVIVATLPLSLVNDGLADYLRVSSIHFRLLMFNCFCENNSDYSAGFWLYQKLIRQVLIILN